jgi:tetratricopeptide (TPR) repeat protein
MKKIGVLAMVSLVSMVSFGSDVESSLEQADKLELQGETESAIHVLKEADAASPDNPQIDKRLSRLYARRIQEVSDQTEKKTDATLAVELGKKAVAKLPNDAQAHIGLAAAYGQICWFVDDKTRVEYSKAIHTEVNKGLAIDPDSDYGHLILARWNFEMATLNPVLKGIAELVYGQFPPASTQAAITHFKKAIELGRRGHGPDAPPGTALAAGRSPPPRHRTASNARPVSPEPASATSMLRGRFT